VQQMQQMQQMTVLTKAGTVSCCETLAASKNKKSHKKVVEVQMIKILQKSLNL
jgi:hypothetical protein